MTEWYKKSRREYSAGDCFGLYPRNDVNSYFFFFAVDLTPRGAGLEGVVFLAAEEGLEARFLLEAEGLALVAALPALLADFFNLDLRSDFGSGSVLREAEAGVTVEVEAGAGGGIFFAASCQLGKKSSMRWREIELARRQRGHWAS